ncbi:MAG: fatty acid desaturase [Myxococcota bacterium]
MAITADAAARDVLSRILTDPRMAEIERIPLLPPVHLALTVGVWATFVGASGAYLTGWLPLPVAMLLNAVAVYVSFTPLHDATHRSVSRDPLVNDLLGTVCGMLLIPGLTTPVYRVLHLEHHRWVGDPERDPDTPLVDARGPWLILALAFPELVWAHWWLTKLWFHRSPQERFAYFGTLGIYVALHVGFLLSPYAWEFVVLWLVPQKAGVMFTVYSFAHIQHPHGVDWRSAPLRATAVIATRPRALMRWVLLGQNDHHIHHLLPHVPWQRYHLVWDLADGVLRRETLVERGLVRGFDEQALADVRTHLEARVSAVREVGEGVRAIRFEPATGTHWPRFEAGAHVDLHLPSGRVRQYSLCNPPTDRDVYEIAVKLDPDGRGGSREVHEVVRPGTTVTLGPPRNRFTLDATTKDAVLVAGGIGLTPLLAMAHALHEQGTPFQMHLCARTREQIPFDAELDQSAFASVVHRHVDQDGRPSFDAASALGAHREGRHVYLCGPSGFMEAVRRSARALDWPDSAIHTESFAAPAVDRQQNRAFEVELRRSRQTLSVPADSTILDELRKRGVFVPTACLQGVCGSCKTRVLEGEFEHRDAVLGEDERREFVCVCVSRAASERLVLDR